MIENNQRILLSAFGVHTGGGLVLLKALMANIGLQLKYAILDVRLSERNLFPDLEKKICYVRKSFIFRIFGLLFLAKKASRNSILFCFNSLPPLIKPKCKVILFVQAPHFADLHYGIKYTPATRVRILIERLWFKFGISNCDEIWVQTSSMAESIGSIYPNIKILIRPFVDDELIKKSPQNNVVKNNKLEAAQYIFFYPADAVGHKNHENLIKAWRILRCQGYRPQLWLTLSPAEMDKFSKNVGVQIGTLNNITNLGGISRCDVLNYLTSSSALLFPSLAETFGLPMLEADNLGIPILASERDFVWDVCAPVQTFDPNSPRSIARAVRRFMCEEEITLPLMSSSKLISCLFDQDSNEVKMYIPHYLC